MKLRFTQTEADEHTWIVNLHRTMHAHGRTHIFILFFDSFSCRWYYGRWVGGCINLCYDCGGISKGVQIRHQNTHSLLSTPLSSLMAMRGWTGPSAPGETHAVRNWEASVRQADKSVLCACAVLQTSWWITFKKGEKDNLEDEWSAYKRRVRDGTKGEHSPSI